MQVGPNLDDVARPFSRSLAGQTFQQQGQVDWVSLTQGGLQFSFSIIGRLTAADVDTGTVTVGHLLTCEFALSRNGRQNIERALAELKSFSGIGNVLWFGLGFRHLVRELAVTDQSATLVALCATLSASFDIAVAAEVLGALARSVPDIQISPSLSQWHNLVAACAGTFALTSFPKRAETLMGMSSQNGAIERGRTSVNPSLIADTLLAVGKLSRRLMKSITIIGPREYGWIAAVAEWLFGLTVTITDENKCLKYTTVRLGEVANVNVLYRSDFEPNEDTMSLDITERIFNLRSALDVINYDVITPERGISQVCGQLEWEDCLGKAFGAPFTQLMANPGIVGRIFGIAARLFEAIAKAEEDVPSLLRRENPIHTEESFGVGFLQHSLHRFPELAPAAAEMHESYKQASKHDCRQALLQYDGWLRSAEMGCEGHPNPSPPCHNPSLCLKVNVETLLVLCRLLAVLDIVTGLSPTLGGLHRLRQLQACRLNVLRPPEQHQAFIAALERIMGFGSITDNGFMDAALTLFSGRGRDVSDEEREYPCSAIARQGICVYLDSLRDLTDDQQWSCRIHVTPGQIQWNNRPYFRVASWEHEPPDISNEELLERIQNPKCMKDVKVSVHETIDALKVGYEIVKERNIATGIHIDPYDIVDLINKHRGWIPCPQNHRDTKAIAIGSISQSEREQLQVIGVGLIIVNASSLGRLAALTILDPYCRNKARCVLRDTECATCCIRAARKEDAREITIISRVVTGSEMGSV